MLGRRAMLVLWSAAGAVVLLVGYAMMVRLGAGQWVDDVAIEGRKSTRLAARRFSTGVMALATPAATVVVGAAIVGFGFVRRGRLAAVSCAVSILLGVAAARMLKDGLARTDLLQDSLLSQANSYPSGHTTAAAVLALMAVTVSSPAWRARVAAVSVAWLVGHTVGMAGSGWHRPSDLIGGMALAVLISALASLPVVSSWRGPPVARTRAWYRQQRPAAAVVAVAIFAPLIWYVPIRLLGTSSYGSFKVHLALALASCGAAALMVIVHARIVDAADVAADMLFGRSPSEQTRLSAGREE